MILNASCEEEMRSWVIRLTTTLTHLSSNVLLRIDVPFVADRFSSTIT
jgi:hypothetical protein